MVEFAIHVSKFVSMTVYNYKEKNGEPIRDARGNVEVY